MSTEFPYSWTKEIPATLIRRLGEAADGFRGRGKAYYVVKLEPDTDGNHEVDGPYEKKEDIAGTVVGAEVTSGVRGLFGPILTGPLGVPKAVTITKIDISTAAAKKELTGKDFGDCMFYSVSAIEKFAIPYYARMFGGDYVKRLHDSVTKDDFLLMVHLPGTEYTNPPSPSGAATASSLPPENQPSTPGSTNASPLPPGIAAVIRMKEDGPSRGPNNEAVVEYILPT